MSENFEILETGQIENLHQQVHARLENGDKEDCNMLRTQHDSLAAELVKRGVVHDTEMICPETETNAPNYRRGFTDDICTNCAFGQLFPFCNLYKFDYAKGFTCDSFRYFEILELEPPHGFLIEKGKQTAIALDKSLGKNSEQAYVIVSGKEAFGVATFDEPAQIKTKEFDNETWLSQHRITQRERRQWWPDAETFYVYRLKSWHPYEGVKLYENGRVINEPKLTTKQWQIVNKAKEMPKQIQIMPDAVSITDKQEFLIYPGAKVKELEDVLLATFGPEIKRSDENWNEIIDLYSLALVRNPRMRVSKKNIAENERKEAKAERKQEGNDMPYEIEERNGKYCVIKIEDGESVGCHGTEGEAEAQLAALRINVEAEEGEAGIHSDKPRKRKPRKKELVVADFSDEGVIYKTMPGLDKIITTGSKKAKKAGFMEGLRNVAKSIGDFLKAVEIEETELLTSNYGVTQKEVNGELWHFTWSTNAFEDREKEIFSTKSLEQYVIQAEEKEDKGYFNFWHIPNTDFAKKQWQGVVGRFLVEAGPYLDNKKGQAAKEFFREFGGGHSEIAPEGWGCSPEFRYLPEERASGIYENIWITRTSTLPKFAAANVWTETRQLARHTMALSEDQIKAAVEVFKDEDFVKQLIQEGETKTAELEAAGVAHKEKTEPQEIQLNMEELAVEVGKQFTANLAPIAEAMATMATELKELKEWREKQDKEQGVKDKTETPRFIFNMQRASEDEKTIVTEDDGLKQQKPKETQTKDGDAWSQIFNK